MDAISIVRSLQIDLILDNPNSFADLFNSIWHHVQVVNSGVIYHEGETIYYTHTDPEPKWAILIDNANTIMFINTRIFTKGIVPSSATIENNIDMLVAIMLEHKLSCTLPAPSQRWVKTLLSNDIQRSLIKILKV